MTEVRQYQGTKLWRKFKVNNFKKIEFWKAVSLMKTTGYITKIFNKKQEV